MDNKGVCPGKIKLTADVKYGEGDGEHNNYALVILGDKTVTLDLNGFVIDRGLSTAAENNLHGTAGRSLRYNKVLNKKERTYG